MHDARDMGNAWTAKRELRSAWSLSAILDLFLEEARAHSESKGYGIDALSEKGLGWVLARLHIKLHVDEANRSVIIRTWEAGLQRHIALRDFQAVDENGVVLAEGISHWAVFDLNSRRATSIPENLRANYPAVTERVSLEPLPRAPWNADAPAIVREHRALPSEIDQNRHVTNSAYAAWIIEACPMKCTELSLTFKSESFENDLLFIESQPPLHRIRRANESQDLVTAINR